MLTNLCRTSLLAAGLITIAAATGCSSSGRNISMVKAPERAYTYYPNQEVYADHDRGLFFWQDTQGWVSATAPPASKRLDDRRAVTVPLRTETPYKVHASVRSAYPPNGYAQVGQ